MLLRKRLFVLVDEDSRIGNIFNTFIILLIILNMVVIILESVKGLQGDYAHFFEIFENFCLTIFTFEYITRLSTADFKYRQYKGARPFFKYIFSFMALVDLLSILPSLLLILLPQGMLADLQFIRMLRIMRVFRVLKITRYSNSLRMMGDVLKEKSGDLSITIFITFILMIIASTLMYYAEHDTQPDQFPDIVHAFWWAVATLTTVGYGDVYPVTALGKILSGVIALLGIGLVALPTGILSSAFVDRMEVAKRKKREKKAARKRGEEMEENEDPTAELPEKESGQPALAPVAAGLTAEQFKEILPDCPHAALKANGDFPEWMNFCPLCGEQM